jgi:hypothetical protein
VIGFRQAQQVAGRATKNEQAVNLVQPALFHPKSFAKNGTKGMSSLVLIGHR